MCGFNFALMGDEPKPELILIKRKPDAWLDETRVNKMAKLASMKPKAVWEVEPVLDGDEEYDDNGTDFVYAIAPEAQTSVDVTKKKSLKSTSNWLDKANKKVKMTKGGAAVHVPPNEPINNKNLWYTIMSNYPQLMGKDMGKSWYWDEMNRPCSITGVPASFYVYERGHPFSLSPNSVDIERSNGAVAHKVRHKTHSPKDTHGCLAFLNVKQSYTNPRTKVQNVFIPDLQDAWRTMFARMNAYFEGFNDPIMDAANAIVSENACSDLKEMSRTELSELFSLAGHRYADKQKKRENDLTIDNVLDALLRRGMVCELSRTILETKPGSFKVSIDRVKDASTGHLAAGHTLNNCRYVCFFVFKQVQHLQKAVIDGVSCANNLSTS